MNINHSYVQHRPFLYENNGDGTFSEKSLQAGLKESSTTMGCNFGDLDNDGYLDFYLATGAPNLSSIVPNKMYKNHQGKYFEDVTYSGGFGHIQKGHAIGFGDLDMDGDQDIYAIMGGAYEGDNFPNILFENPLGNRNNWINIILEGTTSNRGAIGAKIILTIVENGKERDIYHSVGSGASFGGNSIMAEIGLGKAKEIKVLKILWPNKKKTSSTFQNVSINKTVKIKEDLDDVQVMPIQSFEFKRKMH